MNTQPEMHPTSERDESSAIERASSFIQAQWNKVPDVGIILGSGMSDTLQTLRAEVELDYQKIPEFPTSTVEGHAGKLALGMIANHLVAVMKGRVHYYEGWQPSEVVRPVRILARLGIRTLVLTNAVGSVDAKLRAGSLMLIRDHINAMGMNPLRGPHVRGYGERFVDMSDAYDPALRQKARLAARREKIRLEEGVFVGVCGPSYETPAEIQAYRKLGARAIGMSVVPEVIAARQASIPVLAISLVTNLAAGVSRQKLSHEEVLRTSQKAQRKLSATIESFISRL